MDDMEDNTNLKGLDICSFAEEQRQRVEDWVQLNTARLSYEDARKAGLDTRGFAGIFYNEDCIVVEAHGKRSLEYYGGFEYVSEDDTGDLGGYKVYYRNDSRVDETLSSIERLAIEPSDKE